MKKATDLKPDYALAYRNMGLIYSKLGKYADAIAAYEKCVALEPTGGMADEAREHIRWLRKQ